MANDRGEREQAKIDQDQPYLPGADDMPQIEQPAWLALPEPISTNNLFLNVQGRGRVVSKVYADWKKRAAGYIAAHVPMPRFAMPVEITLFVGERGVGQMDSDNTAKAYIDALKAAGVIHDDSRKWVRRSEAIWVPGMAGCVAMIKAATNAPAAAEIVEHVPGGLRELLM